jgi:hypothetical protein
MSRPTILTLLGQAAERFPGRCLFDLSAHRKLPGSTAGTSTGGRIFSGKSYDTCRIEIRSDLTYPLKTIRAARNDAVKEFAYNLAYDPGERSTSSIAARGRSRAPSPSPSSWR